MSTLTSAPPVDLKVDRYGPTEAVRGSDQRRLFVGVDLQVDAPAPDRSSAFSVTPSVGAP
jgi:hypothetical protein